MKDFIVTWEGSVREQYLVTAESEEHAREIWMDAEVFSSEAIEGEVVEVEIDE